MSAFPFSERPYFLKCVECGMKVPLTSEQYSKLPEAFTGFHWSLQVCPNCGAKAYQVYRRDPMIQALESGGKAVFNGALNLAGRLLRKRR